VTYDLGVDLGTTFTAAGVCVNGRVEPVSLGVKRLEVPSVVFLSEQGEFLVGEPAERRGVGEPTRVAREFKRRMGDPVPILIAGAPHSPQSLAARVLRWVVDVVSASQGGRPANIVVTCPANWGPFKRDVLDQVIHLADVGPVTVATEPECAALQYASTNRVADGDVIAVYDLGGGTFDAAVLRKTANGFQPLGMPEGIENLGGADFDEALFGYARSVLAEPLSKVDLSDPATTAALAQLRRECTDAKEALSGDSQAAINVSLPGVQTQVRITRTEFEGMIRSALGDTIAAMRRVLRSADVEPSALTCIVLVGGSSRIPLVAELIRQEFGVPTALDRYPKHTVALGAALLPSATHQSTRPIEQVAPPPPAAVAAPWSAAPPPLASEPRPVEGGRKVPGAIRGGVAAPTAVAVVAGLALGGGGDDGGASGTTAAGAVEVPRGPALPESTLAMKANTDLGVSEIETLAVGANTSTRLTHNGSGRSWVPVLSPDRRSIAYTWTHDDDTAELRIMGSDGKGDRTVARDIFKFNRATWSPDGTRIAYVRYVNTQWDLVILDLTTGKTTLMTDDRIQEGDPSWSPDGTKIAIFKYESDSLTHLYVLDVAAKTEEKLPIATSANDADPTWSPDGKRIAFARTPSAVTAPAATATTVAGSGSPVPCASLFVYDLATKQATQVTDGEANQRDEADPSWSPDGSLLAYEFRAPCFDGENFQVGLVKADGSGFQALTTADAEHSQPAWGRRP
jgi:Tol biopolymer transport system component/actin-like ATPase involved in cell morphogenesis